MGKIPTHTKSSHEDIGNSSGKSWVSTWKRYFLVRYLLIGRPKITQLLSDSIMLCVLGAPYHFASHEAIREAIKIVQWPPWTVDQPGHSSYPPPPILSQNLAFRYGKLTHLRYPLVTVYQKSPMGKSQCFIGKLTISTGPFSIAMRNYQRVVSLENRFSISATRALFPIC